MTVVFAFVGLFVFGSVIVLLYNSLIAKKNQVDNAFASIDALLKKRYDLIPNLISAVQVYMKHERDVLTNITNLRTKAISGNISNDEQIDIDKQMSGAIRGIMVAVENYPDLKASQNFLQLQASLNEVEEQISAARRAYNASVMSFNNAVEMFPTNIMASMMKYGLKRFFEISEQERQNVDVKKIFNT